MNTYTGPCEIQCPLKCGVPAGYELAEVPEPGHAWPDVMVCPNEPGVDFPADQSCGIYMLVREVK